MSEVAKKKENVFLKIRKFHKKTPVLKSLGLFCKYYYVLAIAEYFYTNKIDHRFHIVMFCFPIISHVFFFFP